MLILFFFKVHLTPNIFYAHINLCTYFKNISPLFAVFDFCMGFKTFEDAGDRYVQYVTWMNSLNTQPALTKQTFFVALTERSSAANFEDKESWIITRLMKQALLNGRFQGINFTRSTDNLR